MSIIIGVIEEGLIYAIMALGLYITYKILDFPDLSVDGTFPMGAAVTAMLILKGVHPALTLVLSFAAGLLAGCITGLIHVKLKVRDLLSGIIMMTGLYSINLHIAGRANVQLFSFNTQLYRNGTILRSIFESVRNQVIYNFTQTADIRIPKNSIFYLQSIVQFPAFRQLSE